jgi:hypothetical protein
MSTKGKRCAALGWAALSGLVLPARADAQLTPLASCDSLVQTTLGSTGAGIIYVAGPTDSEGSNGGQAVLQAIATLLGTSAAIIYVGAPSCAALQDLIGGSAGPVSANYLGSGGQVTPCTASGAIPDMAVSDVYGDTCSTGLLTAAQVDLLGPVEATTIVVPIASTEQSISADAAYVIFGFGARSYAVKPWTDPNSIFAPATPSGPLNLVSTAIGLAPNKWANPMISMTPLSAEAKAVSGGKANLAIGILPAQTAQLPSLGVKVLAYQHTGQSCGYFPDSDSLHLDRINVRQGRYALWGPLHFVTNVDSLGDFLDHKGQPNATLSAIASLLVATGPAPMADGEASDAKQAILLAEAEAGLVPWCAMQVIRDGEIGAEASYAAPEPCGCAFESSVGAPVGPVRCATCQTDSDCSVETPSCSYGYCEAQ